MKFVQETKWTQAGEHSVLSHISQRLGALRLHKRSTKPVYAPSAQFTGKNLCENKMEVLFLQEGAHCTGSTSGQMLEGKDSNNDDVANFKD